MSASYYATMGLGVVIPTVALEKLKDSFTEVVESRGCQHDVTENQKFCVECGQPRTIKESVEIDLCGELDELVGEDFTIETSTDERKYFIIAKQFHSKIGDLNSWNDTGSIDIPTSDEVNKVRDRLMAILTPYQAWEPLDFRFWNIGYCSY